VTWHCIHLLHILIYLKSSYTYFLFVYTFILVNSIHDVFTVKQVKELLVKNDDAVVQQECMGIIHGFLTHFDLDKDQGSIIVTRW